MSRYIGPRTKLSKKVGRNLYLKGSRSFSSKDDFTKHPYRSGMHAKKKGAPSKQSEFAKQLIEKQALKFTYGLNEKQLGNLFKKCFRQTGDTGLIALSTLERRLDNVIYRAGFANSRAQARQLVSHGNFTVNGVRVNIPSFIVKIGEIISVRTDKATNGFWQNFQLLVPNDVPAWLDATKKLEVKVLNLPLPEDLPKDFKLPYIVELYSSKVA